MRKTLIVSVLIVALLLISGCVADNNASSSDESSTPVTDESSLPAEVSGEISESAEDSNVILSSGDKVSDGVIKIKIAEQEQIDDTENYIHYTDTEAADQNLSIVVEVSEDIENFCFIELDASIVLQTSGTLYECEVLTADKPLILHTYINDISLNRGISYTDTDGNLVYLGISCSMNDGSLFLIKLDVVE